MKKILIPFYLNQLLVCPKFSCIAQLFILMVCTSCGTEEALKQEFLDEGTWRGIVKLQDQELPFNFEVKREDSVTYQLFIINGQNKIEIKGLSMQGDSVFIPMHIYDATIKAKLDGNKMVGIFQKNYQENTSLPFEAKYNVDYRFFKEKQKSPVDVSGEWRVTFTDADTIQEAIGVFYQKESKVEGTFLTNQGDLGFLEGEVKDSTLWLSSFNGENTFLFKGEVREGKEMSGHFWADSHEYKSWTAQKGTISPEVVFLEKNFAKETDDIFKFKFTDLNGKLVSLLDSRYKDKVKIVHIFGTWDPNSIDQIRFLTDFYKEKTDKDLAIIGLAFEKKDDFNYAKSRINKMVSRTRAPYDFLVAGVATQESLEEKVPILKGMASFPSTIYIDRKNRIRKIENGFAGPASGLYYQHKKNKFGFYVDHLLEEGKENEINLK